MHKRPTLDTKLEDCLRRYLEIQAHEKRLREEKASLQGRLADAMGDLTEWSPKIDGEQLKVRCRASTLVTYNEETLRRKLGTRYPKILALDPSKLRKHLPAVRPHLEPIIELVGAPSPKLVEEAIEGGLINAEDVSGTFEVTVRYLVSVAKPARRSRKPY